MYYLKKVTFNFSSTDNLRNNNISFNCPDPNKSRNNYIPFNNGYGYGCSNRNNNHIRKPKLPNGHLSITKGEFFNFTSNLYSNSKYNSNNDLESPYFFHNNIFQNQNNNENKEKYNSNHFQKIILILILLLLKIILIQQIIKILIIIIRLTN